MKASILFFLLIFVFAGCGETKSIDLNGDIPEEKNKEDSSSEEKKTDDASELEKDPAMCSENWEEAEIIPLTQSHYGFSVKSEQTSWKWDKNGDVETVFLIEKGYWISISDIKQTGNGTLFATGNKIKDTFGESEIKLYEFKEDGVLIEHSIAGLESSFPSKMVIDENEDSIHLLINISSYDDNEYLLSSSQMIATLDKNRDWSFKSWQHIDKDTCTDMVKLDDGFALSCRSYGSNSEETIFFTIVDSSGAYRSTIPFSKRISSLESDGSKWAAIIRSEKQIVKYVFDRFCIENELDYQWKWGNTGADNIIIDQNKNILFTKKVIYENQEVTSPNYHPVLSQIIVDSVDNRTLKITVGMRDLINGKGQVTDFATKKAIAKSNDTLYVSGFASYDITRKDNPGDSVIADIQNYDLRPIENFIPFILAVDSNDNVFIKSFYKGYEYQRSDIVIQNDAHLFVAGAFVETDQDDLSKTMGSYINKIEKTTLTKEKNLVKEEVIEITYID